MAKLLLIHGAAVTSAIWDRLLPHLDAHDVIARDRPRTGDLRQELAWLAPDAEGAWVIGASGGAALGLALAASPVRLAGAVLHEPPVGGLVPDLLVPMRLAFARGGTPVFARTLYGSSWDASMAGELDETVTAREVAMFTSFEPARARAGQGRVVVTVSEDSPVIRHQTIQALHDSLGYETDVVARGSHFVQHDAPDAFAATILRIIGA